MTPTSTRTPEPTLLENYPLASKKWILHAAGTIVKRICPQESQRNIDKIKFDVYRFLTGKNFDKDSLQNVLSLMEAHKLQVVSLLSGKDCMEDNIVLSWEIIVELSDKITRVLRGESITPPWFDSDVPSITDEEDAVDGVVTEANHDKKRTNTFPLGEGHTVSLVPERGKWFRVLVSDGHEYLCTEYSVERCIRGRYLTLYQDGEVIYGYTLAHVPNRKDQRN